MAQSAEREFNPSVENARTFYQGLSLPDVFGKKKDNARKLQITWEQYDEFGKDWNKARKYAASFGLEDIGSMSSQGPTIQENISTPKLTWWLPHLEERGVILEFMKGVNPMGRPLLLEVGYGTGFVAKLLALDRDMDVVGIDNDKDPGKYKTNRVPHIPNTTLLGGDIWDVIDTFGPSYGADERAQRRRIFSQIRESGQSIATSEFLGGLQVGSATYLNEEIASLQQASSAYSAESKVDVALCSFMELNLELTIPIRDGIHPKMIVYVKTDNGKTGAGDFYDALEEEGLLNDETWGEWKDDESDMYVKPNLDTHISFNPGRNYTTVARWKTLWAQDYPHYGHSWASSKPIAKPTGEVVIQVRNDVVLLPSSPINSDRYGFDGEMEELLGANLQEFLEKIESSRNR